MLCKLFVKVLWPFITFSIASATSIHKFIYKINSMYYIEIYAKINLQKKNGG